MSLTYTSWLHFIMWWRPCCNPTHVKLFRDHPTSPLRTRTCVRTHWDNQRKSQLGSVTIRCFVSFVHVLRISREKQLKAVDCHHHCRRICGSLYEQLANMRLQAGDLSPLLGNIVRGLRSFCQLMFYILSSAAIFFDYAHGPLAHPIFLYDELVQPPLSVSYYWLPEVWDSKV